MVTPAARQEAVTHLQTELGASKRRACDVLKVDRSSVRYRSTRPDDADLRAALKMVAAERRRFGYRRVHVMLYRQGWLVNTRRSGACTAKRSYKFAREVAGSVHWVPEGQCYCPAGPTNVGA